MKRFRLLNENDLIRKNYYECVCTRGVNKTPRNMSVYYDEFGYWCEEDNVNILAVTDNSIMNVLKKANLKRFNEILQGGYYEDMRYESDYEDIF